MATYVKFEFAVQMSCQSCVDAIRKSLQGVEGIKSFDINLGQEQVVVETTLLSSDVLHLIEQTGRVAVVKGQGSATGADHLGAAVSILDKPGPVKGVIRMMQVSNDTCVIEGTIDGLTPGLHGLNVHEYGDISQGCLSCGGHFNPQEVNHGSPHDTERHVGDLGNIEAGTNGRATFRLEDNRLKVWDVIGRSMVVHSDQDDLGKNNNRGSKVDGNSGPGIACGIIARSSGLFQNPKQFCACDGVPLWEERHVPVAGPARSKYMQSHHASNL